MNKHRPTSLRTLPLVITVSSTLVVAACGGNGSDSSGSIDTSSGQESQLSSNVAPMTNGSWYQPASNATWTWQLQGALNTSYDVDIYDIDLFDTSAATITNLQADGRKVLCYFSAGSYEDWRDDADQFSAGDLGETLDGYADERWLDIRSGSVFSIMESRLDLAVDKGCDGVEPDNVMAFEENTGFDLTADDQLAFNRHLFNAAHERNLAVALKNDLSQIADLIDYVDIMVNEECHEYEECDQLAAFVAANKPVLIAEYKEAYRTDYNAVCADAVAAGFHTIIFDADLNDAFRLSCDEIP